jgi:hypothetical protein
MLKSSSVCLYSSNAVLYPRWPPLLKIEISSNGQNCSVFSQKVPKFELYKHNDELFNTYYGTYIVLFHRTGVTKERFETYTLWRLLLTLFVASMIQDIIDQCMKKSLISNKYYIILVWQSYRLIMSKTNFIML